MEGAQLALLPGVAAAGHYTASFFQMLFHRGLGHRPARRFFFQIHTRGHHASYVVDALRSEHYIEPERKITPLFAVPALVLAALGYAVLPIPLLVAYLAGLAISFVAHIYLHTHFHLRKSPLARFGWFRRRRALHDLHHLDLSKNFAVFDVFWDRLFRTFCDPDGVGR